MCIRDRCNGEATIILDDEHCGHRKNNWFRDDMLSPTDAEVEKAVSYTHLKKRASVCGKIKVFKAINNTNKGSLHEYCRHLITRKQ